LAVVDLVRQNSIQAWRARVRAALFAEADRCAAVRFLALERACLARAPCDAAECPSFRNAPLTAIERDLETFRLLPPLAFAVSRAACRRVRSEAARFLGGRSFTPARRAFDNPIAIACLVDRAPCLPSRTWCISSRTNSPACVDGAFPSRASSLARSIVSASGTVPPHLKQHASRPVRRFSVLHRLLQSHEADQTGVVTLTKTFASAGASLATFT
jgi:hypothetical protein